MTKMTAPYFLHFAIETHRVRTTDAWLAIDPTDRPLVNLVTLRFSPVVHTIDEYVATFKGILSQVYLLLSGRLINFSQDLLNT